MTIKIVERSKNLAISDFLKADVTCTASKMATDTVGYADKDGFTVIGEYTVPPQQKIALGLRPDILNPNSGGLFHIELHDVGDADIEGEYKVVFRNANGTKKAVIITRRSTTMYKTAPTDRSKQALVKLGLNIPLTWVREDSVIQLLFKPDVNGKVIDYDNANNVFHLEVTVQYPYEGIQDFI